MSEDLPISPFTGEPYDPEWGTQIQKPRLDLRLIYHDGMKRGSSMADCQCRHCRKERAKLFAEGKITAREAGITTVKDEPYREDW